MRQNIRSSLHCFAGVLLLSTVIAARAEEGGVGHYAPGSFASFVDALPGEPGVGAFNYFLCYAGSASANRQFPIAGQIALNVDATSCADSVGAFCITPLKILGANLPRGSHCRSCGRTSRRRCRPRAGGTTSSSDSVSGLGEIEFWPLALSWRALTSSLHVDFFGGIYAPSGEFQKNRLANG